jgi:prepilin-type N-terminal cleavage/methylation domain-containing protein
MRKTRRASAGLSLLEVMIAMTILAVGLLGMLSMQLKAMSATSAGRHVTDAARIGLDQLETLKYQSWTSTAPSAWTAPVVVIGPEAVAPAAVVAGAPAPNPQVYNVSWRVSAVAGLSDARQIDVRVTWREPGDTPTMPLRRYAVSSFKYNGAGTP